VTVDDRTPNRDYRLPHKSNALSDDVARFRDALGRIDSDMATAFSELAARARLASPALSGEPTAPTAASGNNTTRIATTAFVQAAVAGLIASAPATLNSLNELAEALGDDPNFATTMATALGLKAPLASPTFTGLATVNDLTILGALVGVPGRLLGMQMFNDPGAFLYNPSTGVTQALVIGSGAGGGGGGADADAADEAGAGSGGQGGAFAIGLIDTTTITNGAGTIGAGGAGGTALNDTRVLGSAGGQTTWSHGAYQWVLPGGLGGDTRHDVTSINFVEPRFSTTKPTGTGMWIRSAGRAGTPGFAAPSGVGGPDALGGNGGDSIFGVGGAGERANNIGDSEHGMDGRSPGAGGAGAAIVGLGNAVDGGEGREGAMLFVELS
jgi:hypothetical protein